MIAYASRGTLTVVCVIVKPNGIVFPSVDPEHEIDFDRSQEELECIFGAHSPASSVNTLKVGHDGVPCDHYAN